MIVLVEEKDRLTPVFGVHLYLAHDRVIRVTDIPMIIRYGSVIYELGVQERIAELVSLALRQNKYEISYSHID